MLARSHRRARQANVWSGRREAPALYFLHIPKTAGTATMAALRARFHPAHVCPAHLWHQMLAIPAHQRGRYELYMGHFYSHLGPVIGRPLRIITFLRDPVERSLSHYAHVVRDPNHYFHRRAVELGSFGAFLDDPLTSTLITDFQTRALAHDIDVLGEARRLRPDQLDELELEKRLETSLPDEERRATMLSRAVRRLDECAFVGTTEHHQESLDRLWEVLGWAPPPQATRRNVSEHRVQADDLDARTMSRLQDHLRLDQALYELARSRFLELSARVSVS